MVLGDDHTPVPCCSSPFAACRQHVCPSTSTQVTYDACADDCHVHHTQVRAKCEHKHGYTTDPAYTVMFLGGSNSHWIPGLQITAGVCTCILGHTALHRDTWGKGSYKQPVQTKQGFGDPQILCISLSVPLPHLKRPCLPLQKPCLLHLPPFHRVNWPLPYRGKSHPGCQPRAVLSRLQKLPEKH